MLNKRIWLFALVLSVSLATDQLIKYFLYQKLSSKGEFSVITNFLDFSLYKNEGVAFGIPLTGPILVAFLAIVFVTLLILYLKYLKSDKVVSLIALGLVLGGAVGNIIDRIRLGFGIDYVNFGFFPVFNLADVCIVVGVFILIWRVLVVEKAQK